MSSFLAWFMILLLSFVSFLLIVVVLLQRGRGGGLAGAFGGAGGQSAFGTKAGDVFTRITVVMAIVWVMLSGFTGWAMQSGTERIKQGDLPEDGAIKSTDDGLGEGTGAGQTTPKLPTGKPVGETGTSKTGTEETDNKESDSDTTSTESTKPETESESSDTTEKTDANSTSETTETEDGEKPEN